MDSHWKQNFLEKLTEAQSCWSRRFDASFDAAVLPAFDELRSFLADNGFTVTAPLRESGRRSFKFQLAENAYLLVIFRALLVGEYEVRSESFVPGVEPVLKRSSGRLADVTEEWSANFFQASLDDFVNLLTREGVNKAGFRERTDGRIEDDELVLV